MDATPSQLRWDFFLSYGRADRAWAEWIAWLLEEDGHRVLVQAWDFVPGVNWVQGMQDGVATASRIIALLSTSYLGSVYGGAEWQAAWAADPQGRGRKLLTVRVDDCRRPGLLAAVVGIDVFDVPEATVRQRLRTMVAQALTGRAKPETPPPFPSAGRAMPREARFPGALPRVWNLPTRNPNVIGRAAALDDLAAALTGPGAVRVATVRGMGGVGKTQLANEYAHCHAARYDVVWWVRAEEPASIADQFAQLADELGVGTDGDPRRTAVAVHRALDDVPGWLLVFDNADRVADVDRWLPAAPVVPGAAGQVLVTTRRSGFLRLGPVVDLDVVDRDDAVALVRARVPDIPAGVAGEIADELGRLPLALEQVGAYLDRTSLSAAEYLSLLRSRTQELLSRPPVEGGARTVASLFSLSLDRIEVECPAALQLLDVCSHLAPEPIPLDLFTEHPGLLPDPLAAVVCDVLELGEVLGVVVDYSLARRTGTGLHLHRLVQAALRRRQDDRPAVGDPGGPRSGPSGGALTVALRALRGHVPASVTTRPQEWPLWAALLPHVLAATSRGERAGRATREDCSWLLERAGAYLRVQGRAVEARPLLERALAIDEAVHGPDDPAVAVSLGNLALVLRDLGDPAAARPLLERALAITKATYRADHPAVAVGLGNLASVLQELGDPAAARPLRERALAVGEAVYGPDHPTVALRLSNLATVLRDMADPSAARPLLERALRISEAAHGPDHPAVAVRLSNLALVLRDLGDAAGARALLERALAVDEAVYGPDHPVVAVGLGNLAAVVEELDGPAAARPLLERALTLSEAAHGPEHPAVATGLGNLATVLEHLGDAAAARPLLERALAIAEAAHGPDHPTVALLRGNLIAILDGHRDCG